MNQISWFCLVLFRSTSRFFFCFFVSGGFGGTRSDPQMPFVGSPTKSCSATIRNAGKKQLTPDKRPSGQGRLDLNSVRGL